jgi:hypothetical protein
VTTLREYRCEICGLRSSDPIHWFVIKCEQSELSVFQWRRDVADSDGARHFCGEAHAQIYISRWFEAACSPSKPDFNRPSTSGD